MNKYTISSALLSKRHSIFFITILIINSFSGCHQFNIPGNSLNLNEADFKNPQAHTKPGVYWYWINEFISKDGITKDLEALYQIGIGEVFIGNIHVRGLPLGNVKTLSPEWLELDKAGFTGTVRALPTKDQIPLPVNEQLVVELYSR